MSFRQFGGLNYAPKHNIVSSNYNTSNNLLITQNFGQPNSYVTFLSDISGNIILYGNLDITENLHVRKNIDVSGNTIIDGNADISGNVGIGGILDVSNNVLFHKNLNVYGNTDVSGNVTANYMFLSSGNNYSNEENAVMPKSYIDLVSTGINPVGQVYSISTIKNGVQTSNTQYPVPINVNVSAGFYIDGFVLSAGQAVLLNDQGPGGSGQSINNGVYYYTNMGGGVYQFKRNPTQEVLPVSSDAKGAFISVLEGTLYERSGWIQTYKNTLTNLAIVGTDPMIFAEFYSLNFKAGEGLNVSVVGNTSYINVDNSLNFINFLDSTNGVQNASGNLALGTQSTNTIIGPTGGNPVQIQSQIRASQGITGGVGSFSNVIAGYPSGIDIKRSDNTSGNMKIYSDSGNNLVFQNTSGNTAFKFKSGDMTSASYNFLISDNSNNSMFCTSPANYGSVGINTIPSNSQPYHFDVSGNSIFRGYIAAPAGVTGSSGSFNTLAVSGNTTFNNLPTSNVTTPNAQNQLITKAYADATYESSGNLLNSNNSWQGTNAFNISLPTSILYPTSSSEFITKQYADATYGSSVNLLTSNNSWQGTNAFNISLPTSILYPTSSSQLITKAYADATYESSGNILTSNNTWSGTNNFSKQISAPAGITGATGSFNNLYVATKAQFVQDISVNTITIGLGGGSNPLNIAIGSNALAKNGPGANYNIAIGANALAANIDPSGVANVAIGANALQLNQTGSRNTALGPNTLSNNISGIDNVAIGQQALNSNIASDNIGIGYQSLYSNTTGYSNTSIGTSSLRNNIGGYNNTSIGNGGLYLNTVGYDNLALGFNALRANTGGYQNIALGTRSLYSNSNSNNNVAIGYQSLYANVSGNGNIALGYQSLFNNTNSNNISIGGASLTANTSGNNNVALGVNALQNNTIGTGIVSIGNSALQMYNYTDTTTPISNGGACTAVGYQALSKNTTNPNSAFGYLSLQNTTGSSNTGVGTYTLTTNTTGENNTASGHKALINNTTGNNNTAVGRFSLQANTSGTDNTALGYNSGFNNIGSYNTLLGSGADASGNYQYSTAIGYNAKVTSNNQIMLGGLNLGIYPQVVAPGGITGGAGSFTNLNSSNNTYLATTSGQSVGIGKTTTTAGYTLDVSGNTQFTTAPFVSTTLTTPSSSQLITKGYADTAYTQSSANIFGSNNTWTGTNSFMNSVGIGKTTSSYALDVSGNIKLNDTSTVVNRLLFGTYSSLSAPINNKIDLYNESGQYGFGVSASAINYASSNYHNFYLGCTNTSTGYLGLQIYSQSPFNNAFVGINKIPTYNLDVSGNVAISGTTTMSNTLFLNTISNNSNALSITSNPGIIINTSSSTTSALTVYNTTILPSSTGSYTSLSTVDGVTSSNHVMLNTYLNRFSSGSDWNTASIKIQLKVDATNSSFIEFNPPNYKNGIGLYGGNQPNSTIRTGGIIVDGSSGTLYIGPNTNSNFYTTVFTDTSSNYWYNAKDTTNNLYRLGFWQGGTLGGSSWYIDSSGNRGSAVFSGTVQAASFNTTSDYRIKENIKLLDTSYTVDNLNPVTYFNKKTEKQDIGLIAHEVQEQYPCLVNGEKDGEDNQSINYAGLIPILIKEIQDLKKEIQMLKTNI
jgi:hypothetical protein